MMRTAVPARLALTLLLALPTVEAPAWQNQDEANRLSREAVDSALGDSIWYDADTGSILPVEVDPVIDDSLNRNSRWLPKAKRVKAPTGGAATGNAAGGLPPTTGIFGSGLTFGNLLGWLMLIILITFAVGLLVYAISKTEIEASPNPRGKAKHLSQTPDEQTIERMKHLPAELRRTDVNLRSEAERLMRNGNYDQAIILLFGHQLLLLDHVGMLRLNRGKTNRKYVRETRAADPNSAKRLVATVTAFERSYFGRHTIDQREFAELWDSNEKLEAEIERRPEAAA